LYCGLGVEQLENTGCVELMEPRYFRGEMPCIVVDPGGMDGLECTYIVFDGGSAVSHGVAKAGEVVSKVDSLLGARCEGSGFGAGGVESRNGLFLAFAGDNNTIQKVNV
jgi:hypothetical protein